MRSLVGFHGEVVAHVDEDGWADVPRHRTVYGVRLADHVAGPDGIEVAPADVLFRPASFAAPGRMHVEVTVTVMPR